MNLNIFLILPCKVKNKPAKIKINIFIVLDISTAGDEMQKKKYFDNLLKFA